MAKKNVCTCGCGCGCGCRPMIAGLALLIVAAMMYLGYDWMYIFGVLGILLVIKGLLRMKCCK